MAQALQCRGLMLIVPQMIEGRVIMLQRRPKSLDRECEGLVCQGQPPARRQCRIGDQCRRTRRTVDERPALLHLEIEAGREIGKERIEGQDLASATLARTRHSGQGAVIQHGCHGLGDPRAGRGIAFDEIGQPRQNDAAHHAFGQRIAEGRGGGQRLEPRMALALGRGEAIACLLSHRGGHAIDDQIGVVVDQVQE